MEPVNKYLKQGIIPMRLFNIATLLVFCMASHPQLTDDARNKELIIRNRIKSQVSWDYVYSGEKPAKTGMKTSVTIYTASGDISQVNALNPKGIIMHTEKYGYDSRGNKTEYARISGESSYQKKYVYNDKNQLTEESGFDGVENFSNLYTYNEAGELTEIRYMKKSFIHEKRVFEKDDAATMVTVYNKAGALISRLLLKYDNKGNLVEEIVYGINKSELEKKTYHYDDRKNLKEEAKYKQDKITLKTTYNYNSSGALTEIAEEVAPADRARALFARWSASAGFGRRPLEQPLSQRSPPGSNLP
jgi:hypothetical protein